MLEVFPLRGEGDPGIGHATRGFGVAGHAALRVGYAEVGSHSVCCMLVMSLPASSLYCNTIPVQNETPSKSNNEVWKEDLLFFFPFILSWIS